MAQSRRDLLKASAAVAAPYLLSKSARAADVFAAAEPVAYFEGKGYELLPPHGLITVESFNGGIRYDELPAPAVGGKTIRLQGCARLEDIPRRGEPGVLPMFHILGYHNPDPAYPGEVFHQVLDFLVNGSGLNPHRLVLVSTDRFEPMRVYLDDFDIGPHQIVIRPWDEVYAVGDGSGYFRPPDHPHAPGMPTVSFHYPLPGTALESEHFYPLPGYLELGEVSISQASSGGSHLVEGGIGVERVAMARGDVVDTYEEALIVLANEMEAEAQERGVPLPSGFQQFQNL
ncbi:MAG: twin-arginine translocation signal domain-containing protein [Pseudomonadota bacterium]